VKAVMADIIVVVATEEVVAKEEAVEIAAVTEVVIETDSKTN
jgi:hypothetical protein